jgi:ABC-2 type transport system permease protein
LNKLITVLRQEYLLKVRTKAFLFGTFVVPLLMAGLTVVPGFLMSMSVGKPGTFAVVDGSGVMLDPLQRALNDSTKAGQRLYDLVEEPAAGRSSDALARDLGTRVAEGKLAGFIILPDTIIAGGEAAFYAENVSDFQRNEKIQHALEKAVREVRINRSRLDAAQVTGILKDVPLTTFKVGQGGEVRKDRGSTFAVAYAVGFIFYFALVLYGSMMVRAVLEEKTSRSAEVMVATVRASTLMGGKILGIGAVALTQLAIWGAILGLFSLYASSGAVTLLGPGGLGQFGLNPSIAVFFPFYFILGFMFYAAIFAAVGAMVSSENEAQQLQFPISMPLILAFLLMLLAIRDPNAPLVRVCSFIPFFSPILMMVRICVQMPPAWEILASLAVLALSIAGVIWVAGRVFRVGILMYGKRPNLPELMKWIRHG